MFGEKNPANGRIYDPKMSGTKSDFRIEKECWDKMLGTKLRLNIRAYGDKTEGTKVIHRVVLAINASTGILQGWMKTLKPSAPTVTARDKSQ